ncbi:hypothetical protein ILUMI_08081 [Ignelater luminosus]|uniref:Uncharacterized protein n=1 Tax=Ignelater luminosus TaxID=2038154 RepID=A0A8K0GHD9_IGNLU|nr:hypothetical protein ILUMI_08081 [Ignelater luminosus]
MILSSYVGRMFFHCDDLKAVLKKATATTGRGGPDEINTDISCKSTESDMSSSSDLESSTESNVNEEFLECNCAIAKPNSLTT